MGNNLQSCGIWALVLATLAVPARASAQLPFDLTREDFEAADTSALRWVRLSTFVGGAEGELRYLAEEVEEGECKAVAYLGLLQLRNYYARREGEAPVSLRMSLRCGARYEADVRYDGIAVRLELRDRATRQVVYRGSKRGPP